MKGATHSFIARDYVDKLKLLVSKLPYDLVVSTPSRGPFRTNQI